MDDREVTSPPRDPVSAIKFFPGPSTHPRAQQALISSWDQFVRLVDLGGEETTSTLHSFEHEAAVLDTCWISPSYAASGSVDRRVRLLDLETGKTMVAGKHAAPVCRVRYSAATGLLLTASWDRTLAIWDVQLNSDQDQSQEPRVTLLHKLTLPDKALAMDISPPWPRADLASEPGDPTVRVLVATAGRHLVSYSLSPLADTLREAHANGQTLDPNDPRLKPEWTRESALKFMVRDLACMPNGLGFAASSVEGRVSVDFFDSTDEGRAKGYAFKCHRVMVDGIDTVYPVNALVFHPIHGTFASIGGDAVCALWDATAKKRLRQYPRFSAPLSTAGFSCDGQLLAIAAGAENIEDSRHPGPGAGEVGGIGPGGPGNVRIFIKKIYEDAKAKSQA